MKRTSFVALQLACVMHVHGFLETKNQTHACMQPRDPGHCRASMPRWYFDVYHQVCKEFIYGGCQGNGNRFETKTACETACSQFKGKKTPCMLQPDTGPCRAYILNWFFDKKHHVCKMFVYGGCRGNTNRFASEKECEATCLPQSTRQGICSLDPMSQRCNARAQFWHFDPVEDTCHRFPRGFCGNSANRFPTCEKCMKRCSRANAFQTCSLAYRKIHYGKQGISWPGKREPRVRGPGVRAPGHPGVGMPTISGPGAIGTVQGENAAPTLITRTPTLTGPGEGVNGLTGSVGPALGIGGSIANNSQVGGPLTRGSRFPGYTISGHSSTGSGHEGIVHVVPLPPASSGITAPRRPTPFTGGPNSLPPTLIESAPTATVRTGPVTTLPGPISEGAPGSRITAAVRNERTETGPGIPGVGIIPGSAAITTHASSSMASSSGQPGSPLAEATLLNTVHAGARAGVALERGSNSKYPPLSLPAHFLLQN